MAPARVRKMFSGFRSRCTRSGRVRRHQAARHVHADPPDVLGGQRPARDPRAQRFAVEQLHDEIRPPVEHADVKEPDDVGMIQRRGDARFLHEAFDALRVAVRGAGRRAPSPRRRGASRTSVARYTSPIPPRATKSTMR